MECHGSFIDKQGIDCEEIAKLFYLLTGSDEAGDEFNANQARTQLNLCYEEAEHTSVKIELPQPLADNIQQLNHDPKPTANQAL